MDAQNNGVEPPSPRELLAAFSGGRIVFWIVAAVLIHVVVIGGLSVGYIRDRWIDPEGAAVRKAAAAAAVQALKQQAEAKNRPPAAPVKNVSTNTATASVAASTNAAATATTSTVVTGNVAIPAGREDTPVVKRITEKTPSNALPRQPGELGISIEDTNRQ